MPLSSFFQAVLWFLALVLLTVVKVGPFSIIGILLLWVVLFRPTWFYELVLKIYSNK